MQTCHMKQAKPDAQLVSPAHLNPGPHSRLPLIPELIPFCPSLLDSNPCRRLTFPRKQVAEHLAQVREVGLVIKAQRAAVLEVCHKLKQVALAQNLFGAQQQGDSGWCLLST